MAEFVLRSKRFRHGTRSYFKQMTGIGPSFTPTLKDAARFATREEAAFSPAMRFTLTILEVVEVVPRSGGGEGAAG